MSEEKARDTQFQGFAKALYESLYDQFSNLFIEEDDGEIDQAKQTNKGIQETIARRAYDFACHVVENVSAYNVLSIPDMSELPKEQEA